MGRIIDIIGGVLIGIVVVIAVVLNKRSHGNYSLDKRYFQRRWTKLQKLCSDRKLWYKAIVDADNLLDEALKRKHFKGKSTGERLVSAQHYFSSNDSLWFSHKLKNRIEEEDLRKLTKQQTLDALASFKLALTDIEALSSKRKGKTS